MVPEVTDSSSVSHPIGSSFEFRVLSFEFPISALTLDFGLIWGGSSCREERYPCKVEVVGSTPTRSTRMQWPSGQGGELQPHRSGVRIPSASPGMAHWSRGPGHHPLTVETGVRVPYAPLGQGPGLRPQRLQMGIEEGITRGVGLGVRTAGFQSANQGFESPTPHLARTASSIG